MTELFKLTLDNFWSFLGGTILLVVIVTGFVACLNLIVKLVNRFIRSSNIKAKGWPPSHCDADGDPYDEN